MAESITPSPQHAWLQQLVGEWTYETEASAAPGATAEVYRGSESVRSLGGLWTIGEGRGESPGTENDRTIMTLGFNPATGRFVGTFVSGMMADLWVYDGELDADRRVLTMFCEGPSFTTEGKRSPYRDTIEFVSADHRTLVSRYQDDNGEWQQFMASHYRRSR